MLLFPTLVTFPNIGYFSQPWLLFPALAFSKLLALHLQSWRNVFESNSPFLVHRFAWLNTGSTQHISISIHQRTFHHWFLAPILPDDSELLIAFFTCLLNHCSVRDAHLSFAPLLVFLVQWSFLILVVLRVLTITFTAKQYSDNKPIRSVIISHKCS